MSIKPEISPEKKIFPRFRNFGRIIKKEIYAGDTMTERQQLISQKLHILSVKKILGQLSGIDVIEVVWNDENTALGDMYSAYVPVMCSYATVPYNKISYKSTEEQIIFWITTNMGLKENTEYFFRCNGVWVKIKFSDLYSGIKSLWKHQGIGFMLANSNATRIMEVSFDSRDENNYLLDIWDYTKQEIKEGTA